MKFLREPLVQFVLLGAVLFAAFSGLGKLTADSTSAQSHITITPAKIDELIKGFKLDFKRSPTQADVDKLINDYIREEILCREAWAQGIDRDDRVIRARLRQKMEFFNDSSAGDAPEPSEQELTAFLQAHPQMFRQPEGGTPQLADVRDNVLSAWTMDQRRKNSDAAYEKLKAHYTIVVERPRASATQPTTAESQKAVDAR